MCLTANGGATVERLGAETGLWQINGDMCHHAVAGTGESGRLYQAELKYFCYVDIVSFIVYNNDTMSILLYNDCLRREAT